MSKKHRFRLTDKASPVEMDKKISKLHQDLLKRLMKAGGDVS